MSDGRTDEVDQSYREVLRNRRLAGLLIGDLMASIGTGMLIVAMPVESLDIHGDVPKAVAIGGLVLSGVFNLLLLPIAAVAVLRDSSGIAAARS